MYSTQMALFPPFPSALVLTGGLGGCCPLDWFVPSLQYHNGLCRSLTARTVLAVYHMVPRLLLKAALLILILVGAHD